MYVRLIWLVLGFGVAATLCACLSTDPNAGGSSVVTPVAKLTPPAETQVAKQPQPGSTGTTMSGTVTLNGAPPPPDSTLYIGLAKPSGSSGSSVCIDAERDPVDASGRFSAEVACSPASGDQLTFTLVIGAPGDRNWHSGALPVPSDLTALRLDAP